MLELFNFETWSCQDQGRIRQGMQLQHRSEGIGNLLKSFLRDEHVHDEFDFHQSCRRWSRHGTVSYSFQAKVAEVSVSIMYSGCMLLINLDDFH